MPTMADAVNPAAIPAGVAAVCGYIDGPESKWSETAWAKFSVPALQATVLANPAGLCFDLEPGNAGATAVAVAVRTRFDRALPSVVYLNSNTAEPARSAMTAKMVPWLDAVHWPAPGAYLWAADWSVTPGTVPAWCWVAPVAVQDRSLPSYDLSTLYSGWLPVLAPPTPPGPVPPSIKGKDVPMVILRGPDGSAYVVSGGKAVGLTTGAEITAATAAGIPVWQFANQAQYEAVVAGFA